MAIGKGGRDRKQSGKNRVGLVMDHDRVLVFVCHVDHFEGETWRDPKALFFVGTEQEGLAVLHKDAPFLALGTSGDVGECTIVEDVAVLENLDERGACVCVSFHQQRPLFFHEDVDGAAHERSVGTEGDPARLEGVVDASERRGLVRLPGSDVGEYWPW